MEALGTFSIAVLERECIPSSPMAKLKLTPVQDKNRGKWRLSIPASVSQNGKRQRRWYDSVKDANAAVERFQKHRDEFGNSAKLLDASRLLEAADCWKLLDKFGHAPPNSIRRIIVREVRARSEREKSIPLSALFDDYIAKLKRNHRSANYLKQFTWLRGYFREFLEEKVSDLKPSDLNYALEKLPGGNFNSNLRLIRAVLNHGVKKGLLKSNPALQLETVYRPPVEFQPLSNEIVQAMLMDAATTPKRLGLLTFLTLGFFTGCRHAELIKLTWEDIRMDEPKPYVFVKAHVSKTKIKRFPPLPTNAVEWLRLYIQEAGRPTPDEFILTFSPNRLRAARQRNYEAATGSKGAQCPPNALRRTFASNHIAAFEDYQGLSMILGHTTNAMSFQYVQGIPNASALAFFEIRP